MTGKEVLKLIEAGFSAAEIRAMDTGQETPAPEAAPVEPEAPGAEPEAAPAPVAVPEKESSPAPDVLDGIKQQIQGLTDVVDRMSKVIIAPNMDDVNPLGVDDIITNFFKED